MRLWNVFKGLNTNVNFGKISVGNIIDKVSLQLSTTEFGDYQDYVFLPSNRNASIFHAFSGTLEKSMKGHFDTINCCLYNPILNEMYSGSKDKNLLIWSPPIKPAAEDNQNSRKRHSDQDLFNSKSSKQRTSNNSWSDDE
jgi:DNA excision repair protein ERCC-8